MKNDDNKLKFVLYGLGALTAFVGSYFYISRKNENDEEESKRISNKQIEEDLAKKKEEIKLKEKEEREEKNKLVNVDIFTECLKRVINHGVEQLFIFNDIVKQNYDKEGNFIGNDFALKRDLNVLKAELLQKLQLENTQIIMTCGLNPTQYNNSLHHYLGEQI